MPAEAIKVPDYEIEIKDFYKYKPLIEKLGCYPMALASGHVEEMFLKHGSIKLMLYKEDAEKFMEWAECSDVN